MTASLAKRLDLRSIEAAACKDKFRHFVECSWPIVEPAKDFIANWHIDAIADHLQAVSDGHIQRLLITVPPGHAKSLLVSVQWPVWVWLCRNPKWRGMFTSYAEALSLRDAERSRTLLESLWVRDTFAPTWSIGGVLGFYKNSESGFRMSFGVGGKGTGFRGDALITDDPLNARDSHSEAALNNCTFWWDEVMSSRFNDLAKAVRVIIMQRLTAKDLAGHVLERGGYEHLCLPTYYEPDRKAFTIIGFQDPRTEKDELLFPALFPLDVVKQAEKDMGSTAFSGQHQQRPAPAGGGLWKRQWWRYWKPKNLKLPPVKVRLASGDVGEIEAVDLPDTFDEEMQSWDCAFKDLKDSDFVCGGQLARKGADIYLRDAVHDRLAFTETLAAIRALCTKYPKTGAKLIEDKANGTAVIDTLRHDIPGLIAINPEGGKYARAAAVTPTLESGNVYLPHPLYAEWVDGFLTEAEQFPNGANDDWVDMLSQALNRWQNKAVPQIRSLRD